MIYQSLLLNKQEPVTVRSIKWDKDKFDEVAYNINNKLDELTTIVESNINVNDMVNNFSKAVIDCVFPVMGKEFVFDPSKPIINLRGSKKRSSCEICAQLKRNHLIALRNWHRYRGMICYWMFYVGRIMSSTVLLDLALYKR